MNVETKTERGRRERTLIDVTSARDIKYWTEQFGVGADELRAAVKVAGEGVATVETYLKKSKAEVPD